MSLLDAHTAEVLGLSRGARPGLGGTAVEARQPSDLAAARTPRHSR